jgi:hypothetical protein
MSGECEDLDAFLADGLSPHDRVRYERHLAACETCREAANQQHWIDLLLSSPERLELERVSPALRSSVRVSIASRVRQARLVACGLAGAAALVIAVGWTVALSRHAAYSPADQIAETGNRDNEPSPSPSLRGRGKAEAPRAVFVGGMDVITVPVASRHPNVTIVRVYPTYQSTLASQSPSEESDADYSNGG